jgi:cytochrome c553
VRSLLLAGVFAFAGIASPQSAASLEFTKSVRPVLLENCGPCHSRSSTKTRVDFLKAESAEDIESNRGLWRSVAAQLRNRTMPPVASKLTEQDRLHIATWVENRLRATACSAGEFAGAVTLRRLNRREYHNTIRDLLGVDFAVTDLFPADGSGGEGFDNNGETLFLPPLLMERYLEAAQQILDRVIVTPALHTSFASAVMEPAAPGKNAGRPLSPGEKLSATVAIYADGEYNLRVSIERPRGQSSGCDRSSGWEDRRHAEI